MRFLNASVLERKALNRNLGGGGFPLGNLLPKTRVLKHRFRTQTQTERKRKRFRNAAF